MCFPTADLAFRLYAKHSTVWQNSDDESLTATSTPKVALSTAGTTAQEAAHGRLHRSNGTSAQRLLSGLQFCRLSHGTGRHERNS